MSGKLPDSSKTLALYKPCTYLLTYVLTPNKLQQYSVDVCRRTLGFYTGFSEHG